MSLPIAAWRATYTPGTWVVLAAPTSLVVLQPAPARVSDLLNRFWDDTLGATSLESLSTLLAQHNLAELGSVGLFFWGDGGVTAMVRGQIRVTEAATGRPLATGQGGPGWQPVSIGDQTVRIDLEPVDPNAVLHLPLVVGGVAASSLVLSMASESLVRSAQSAALGGGAPVVPAGVPIVVAEAPAVADAPVIAPPVVVPPAVMPIPEPVVPPVVVPTISVPEFTGDLGEVERDLVADDSVPLDDVLAQVDQPASDPVLDEPTGDILPGDSAVVEPAPGEDAVVVPEPEPVGEDVPVASVEAEEVVPAVVLPPAVESAFVPPPGPAGAFVPPPASVPGPPTEPLAPPPPMYAPGAGLVTAVVCTLGHPNPPGSNVCRQCHGPVGSISRLVQRPTLAVVRSSFGVALDLDSVILIGRAPDTQGDTSVRVLKVPSPNTDISRSHLKVRANEWQIEVTDLNSTNGSVLAIPGQAPVRMTPGAPTAVPLGAIVDLGDGVQIRIDPPR